MEQVWDYFFSNISSFIVCFGAGIVFSIVDSIIVRRYKRKIKWLNRGIEELKTAHDEELSNMKRIVKKDFEERWDFQFNHYKSELEKQESVSNTTIKRLQEELRMLKDCKRHDAVNVAERALKDVSYDRKEFIALSKDIYNFIIGK